MPWNFHPPLGGYELYPLPTSVPLCPTKRDVKFELKSPPGLRTYFWINGENVRSIAFRWSPTTSFVRTSGRFALPDPILQSNIVAELFADTCSYPGCPDISPSWRRFSGEDRSRQSHICENDDVIRVRLQMIT